MLGVTNSGITGAQFLDIVAELNTKNDDLTQKLIEQQVRHFYFAKVEHH